MKMLKTSICIIALLLSAAVAFASSSGNVNTGNQANIAANFNGSSGVVQALPDIGPNANALLNNENAFAKNCNTLTSNNDAFESMIGRHVFRDSAPNGHNTPNKIWGQTFLVNFENDLRGSPNTDFKHTAANNGTLSPLNDVSRVIFGENSGANFGDANAFKNQSNGVDNSAENNKVNVSAAGNVNAGLNNPAG